MSARLSFSSHFLQVFVNSRQHVLPVELYHLLLISLPGMDVYVLRRSVANMSIEILEKKFAILPGSIATSFPGPGESWKSLRLMCG